MWLIKDYRTGKVYKCHTDIRRDKLCQLHQLPFLKAGVLTEKDFTEELCYDRFSYFYVIGKVDGRRYNTKNLEWFTWLLAIES